MIEGLKKLYTGEKVFSRQLMLFSICGIIGLFNALVSFPWVVVNGRSSFVEMILLLSPLFSYCGLSNNIMKHKLESRLLGEISINSYMQMTRPL